MPKKKMEDKKRIGQLIKKFEDYYALSKTYIQIQSPKMDLSIEDKDIINNHPEIFFQASKSRILLLVWLCKILRTTFELYGYSDLEMPNETYEILRNHFKTKAFNRVNYLSAFDCSTSNILTYNHFVELEQNYINQYNMYAEDSMKLSLMPHIGIRKIPEPILLKKELANILPSTRTTDIIYMRSQGKTLDDVGEQLGITRERARQLEIKPKNNIERWLATREKDICDTLVTDNLLNQKKAQKEFGARNWNIVKYTIACSTKNNKLNFKYFEPFDLLYYSQDKKIEESIEELKQKFEEEKSEDMVSDFTKALISMGYSFWNKEYTKRYFKENHYSIYGKQLHEGKITIGKSISTVAKNFYPNGIKITNQEEFEEFTNRVKEIFKLNVKPDRAFLTRVQTVLIMKNKSEYISPRYVKFDLPLMKEIEKYVKGIDEERISYEALFNVFKEKLLKTTSIDNHYYLHGVLRYLVDNKKLNLLCYRYYIGKPENEKTKSKEFFRVFYNYLVEKKKPVKIETLLKDFPSWNESYFRYSMVYFPTIVQWSKDEYICMDGLEILPNQKEIILKTIDSLLDNDINYTSSYVIFNKLSLSNPSLLEDLEIDNESKMYYISQFVLNEKYYCRKPHILKNWTGNFSTQELVKLVFEKHEIVNKPKAMEELVEYYGSNSSSLNLAIQKELNNYIKISTFEYVKKNKISLTKTDLDKITNLIKSKMIKGEVLLPNTIESFKDFPKIAYTWNAWVLCEIIYNYNLDFKVIGNRTIPSQNALTIILKTNSTLNDKADVFNWLLKNDYDGDNSLPDIFKYAKKIGIFHTNLTQNDIQKIIV